MGVPDVRMASGFLASVTNEMSRQNEDDYRIGFLYGNRDGDILLVRGVIIPERKMYSTKHFNVNPRDVSELQMVAKEDKDELFGAIHFQGGNKVATYTDMESCFSFAYAEKVGDWLCLVVDGVGGACAYWISGEVEQCIFENTRLAG